MSSDKGHLPRTGGMAGEFGKHGKKPRMRDCAARDEKNKVNWEVTSRDFPLMPEMQRQLAKEKKDRGEK